MGGSSQWVAPFHQGHIKPNQMIRGIILGNLTFIGISLMGFAIIFILLRILNGVRDNFYFAPDSAEGKRQKQRLFNTETFFPYLPSRIDRTQESLSDLA